MMSKLARLSAFVALLVWAPPVAAEDARTVMKQSIDQVLAALREPGLSHEERLRRVEKVAEARFDFKRMSKLVLARNRKKLSAEQQDEFLVEFQKHLTMTYGRRLGEFSNETIEMGDARTESNGDVTVKTIVRGGAADGVLIDYRMRARDDSWYVIDVIIEGISLISNFRSQVQEIVSTKGANQLIDVLREKNEKEEQES